MAGVDDLPRRAAARTAKLAGLPLGYAGRATLGLGRRLGGRPAELVAAEVQARTAEQLFKVLGELKGGAMKFGQAMSVFEAALPENLAGPYRETLTRLQESAPPLPARTVHAVLATRAGRRLARPVPRVRRRAGRGRLDRAGAPGGVVRRPRRRGQGAVPRCRRGAALRPQPDRPDEPAGRDARARPGRQAAGRRAEGAGRRGARLRAGGRAARPRSPRRTTATRTSSCPSVVDGTEQVLVSEWVDGIAAVPGHRRRARREQRDRARVCCSPASCSPGRPGSGLLHADPHPGNFRLLDDGRLVVLDFGAVNRLPDGLPPPIGPLLRLADRRRRRRRASPGCATRGSSGPAIDLDAQRLLDYLAPILEPARAEQFRFSRVVAALPGGPGRRPAVTGVQHRAAAQPAAGLPADPPGHAGRHRRALPARGRGAVARRARAPGCRASPAAAPTRTTS